MRFLVFNYKYKTKNGFTLFETLVAIFIIILGIMGLAVVFSKIISPAQFSSLYFIASYLAQEGIEIARNIRDENLINFRAWDYGLAVGDHRVEYDKNYLLDFSEENLMVNENGFYNYGGGDKTPFKRKITIEKHPSAILVTAEISFNFKEEVYTFSAQEYLYKWVRYKETND